MLRATSPSGEDDNKHHDENEKRYDEDNSYLYAVRETLAHARRGVSERRFDGFRGMVPMAVFVRPAGYHAICVYC